MRAAGHGAVAGGVRGGGGAGIRIRAAGVLTALALCGCFDPLSDYWASLERDAAAPGGSDADADSDGDADGDTDGDADADTDADGDADADTDADTESASETEGCEDTGSDTGPDGDADGDADTDADGDADTDADGDADGDADADMDAGADAGPDPLPDCPDDMVPVPADPVHGVAATFCLDKYEASRDDATAAEMGDDTSVARSVADVQPWRVNPMTAAHLETFAAACAAAGKRLCTKAEWHLGCAGTAGTLYSWGDAFDREICNCVDTYCDDHCAAAGIPAGDCYEAANCGYHCGAECPSGSCGDASCAAPYCSTTAPCFAVQPTGAFAGCADEFGAFDVNGNVWEVVPSADDPRGYEVRGGAFNCASASARLQCTYNAGWNDLFAGFRCCRDPE